MGVVNLERKRKLRGSASDQFMKNLFKRLCDYEKMKKKQSTQFNILQN